MARSPARAGSGAKQTAAAPRSRRDRNDEPDWSTTDPIAAAHTICLNQLAARARTRAELVAVLAKRGIPDEAARQVLGRLAVVGLVDDASFTDDFVSARHRDRGLSRAEINRQLRLKGVDPALAEQATASIDPESERATATALVQRRLPGMSNLDTVVLTRRLVGLLARKGYSAGLCYAVVSAVLEEHRDDSRNECGLA